MHSRFIPIVGYVFRIQMSTNNQVRSKVSPFAHHMLVRDVINASCAC